MSKRERMHGQMAQARVDAWKHPVGTPVTVRKDDGMIMATTTRCDPWVMCGTAVIMVEGICGAYALDRVTAVTP